MADQEHDGLISQFAAISGVDSERARFYLESAAWQLETALSSFYEDGEDLDAGVEDLGERPKTEGAPSTPQRVPLPQSAGRLNMFDGSSSDDEDQQAFYAGGSETSGQQVLGPKKKDKDVVASLFKSAKEHGAEVLEGRGESSKKKKAIQFVGTGYKLGQTESDHQEVPNEEMLEMLERKSKLERQLASARSKNASVNAEVEALRSSLTTRQQELDLIKRNIEFTKKIPAQDKSDDGKPRDVMLRMWKTGFTVDDSELRSYEDPANAEFLQAIRRSEVPLELIREARGGEVYINMADHRHEDYVPKKKARPTFSGAGHTLGSVTPNVVGQETRPVGASGGAMGTTVVTGDPKLLEKKAQEQVGLDASQPTTNIQVRLPDGSRLILKLNHTHTVGTIRQFVRTARPSYSILPFALMTTFPYAELSNDAQTVSDAKLLNAAIVVKPK